MNTHANLEARSRDVAEAAREREWRGKGFLREIYLGNFHFDWVDPFPHTAPRPRAVEFLRKLRAFLEERVDSVEIDRSGEYPEEVLAGLRELGAFGMKIPEEYGGLGFDAGEYSRAIELCAEYDASIVALLSAHQSIGVPQPILMFGTEAQKRRYLPRCARGAVSAFALTETDAGSDPARIATTFTRTAEGYVVDGVKLWCTNGTLAELFVVMARDPHTDRISAFVVEADAPGVEVVHRCRFMGIRAIANAVVRFGRVHVPAGALIGREGEGLKIALATLNTGRLSLPAACVGVTRRCVAITREWAGSRVQWGLPIGRHEAVAHKIARMTSTAFAIDSMTRLATELSMREGYDIRLEAAAAKEWTTVQTWQIVDDTLQIRGGRGYETEASLRARGEPAIGVERMMRDCRINLIFEGSSEIMHLFMAREAVDKHLEVAGDLVQQRLPWTEKLRLLPAILFFYAWWYPSRWFHHLFRRYGAYGAFAEHLRFCDRATRRVARALFHGMVVHRARLERRQAFLFRVVDVANEIFAMAATVSHAARLGREGAFNASSAAELADAFCRESRRRVSLAFRDLWRSDDASRTLLARQMLEDRYRWLEHGHARAPEPGDRPGAEDTPAAATDSTPPRVSPVPPVDQGEEPRPAHQGREGREAREPPPHHTGRA